MKTIISVTRTRTDLAVVAGAISSSGFLITEMVSGGAPGVDTLGEHWAHELGIPVSRFLADWTRYGRRAGPIRNMEMADFAEALIAVWDGKSKGTGAMIGEARRRRLQVFVHYAAPERETFETWHERQRLCSGWT
jgi:hypothetical protein